MNSFPRLPNALCNCCRWVSVTARREFPGIPFARYRDNDQDPLDPISLGKRRNFTRYTAGSLSPHTVDYSVTASTARETWGAITYTGNTDRVRYFTYRPPGSLLAQMAGQIGAWVFRLVGLRLPFGSDWELASFTPGTSYTVTFQKNTSNPNSNAYEQWEGEVTNEFIHGILEGDIAGYQTFPFAWTPARGGARELCDSDQIAGTDQNDLGIVLRTSDGGERFNESGLACHSIGVSTDFIINAYGLLRQSTLLDFGTHAVKTLNVASPNPSASPSQRFPVLSCSEIAVPCDRGVLILPPATNDRRKFWFPDQHC